MVQGHHLENKNKQAICNYIAVQYFTAFSTQFIFQFFYNDLDVTQSLHGNVYKVVNYEGRVTDVCHHVML